MTANNRVCAMAISAVLLVAPAAHASLAAAATYDVKSDEHEQRIVTPVPSNLVKIDTQRGIAVAPDDTPQPLPQFEQRVNDTLRDLRNEKTRMDLLAAEKLRREASLWSVAKENRWMILIALAGIAFATWRLLRR